MANRAEVKSIGEIHIINRDEKKQDTMRHTLQARAQKAFERDGTVLSCTRYGNVMCSRGSGIPLFIDQIKKKDSITITDPNMTRFPNLVEKWVRPNYNSAVGTFCNNIANDLPITVNDHQGPALA